MYRGTEEHDSTSNQDDTQCTKQNGKRSQVSETVCAVFSKHYVRLILAFLDRP